MTDKKDLKNAKNARPANPALSIASALIALILIACDAHALGVGMGSNELAYTPEQPATLSYYIINEKAENILFNVDVVGDLENYSHLEQDNYWYSTRRDQMSAFLTREIDLTNVSSATLKFYTKYSIEYGWDFGYVQISTNNGTTWSQLPGTTTTTYRDPGVLVGIAGAPAYTGAVGSWTLETINLTPYAGNLTLLRFWYVTDTGWAEHGWQIDDITIPEIGFTDDVEGEPTTWTAVNWLKDVVQITDNSSILPIKIAFTIPSNYTEDATNGTPSKLIVTQISGVEGAWNPTQESVPQIIVLLPPLRRIEPPASPPSGGGGGGGGTTESYSYSGETMRYYTTVIYGNSMKTITPSQLDTPIETITVTAAQNIQNAVLTISMLDSAPTEIKQQLNDVYSYFDIDAPRIEDIGLKSAVIKFQLPTSWVDSRTDDPQNVALSLWDGVEWQDLPITLVRITPEMYTYEAVTQTLDVFAARIASDIEPALLKPAPTPKQELSKVPDIIVINTNETNMTETVMDILQQKTGESEENVYIAMGMEPPARESPVRIILASASIITLVSILAAAAFIFIKIRRRKKDGGALLLAETAHAVQAGKDKHASSRHEHRTVHRRRSVQPKTAGHGHKAAHRKR